MEEEEKGSEAPGWEQALSPELRQGMCILRDFLLEKNRPLVTAFLQGESEEDPGLLAMEEGFRQGRYQDLGDFVADFRLMLEGCYRRRGVEHWMSKQAQRLEGMLEQKLSLLSRPLREKTTIVVTSKGRYGLEAEKMTTCTSTRRRSTSRSLAGTTTGAFESIMVQAIRQEEQLKARQEKRLREQGKKEAGEANYKEIDEWEKNLLAQAAPTLMENMWEIPAIGHFLCLAQHILNLPEIVFYELERCLLMPHNNVFLSKVMTSLLSPPYRRPSLHRRPPFPYRSWEAALRQKVKHWYSVVGQAENPDSCAEKLGLCSEFFRVLGDVSPLEEKPFHELSFHQKVWLLKGLCDFVYETQVEVQDAVLGQPIHECREVILGYDSQENSYIHFPQFCGADVRIYKQIPFHAPVFPIPKIKIRHQPRAKLERVRCEAFGNSSCDGQSETPDKLLSNAETEVDYVLPVLNDCIPDIRTDCCTGCTEQDTQSNCEMMIHRSCDRKEDDCCKENMEKPVGVCTVPRYSDMLSPGEIRVVENGEKYIERPLCKTVQSPLKENTLKTCQVHVNGSHCDKIDTNCHVVAQDIYLECSLLNCKQVKLSKVHGKKKKKKKKKHILNENLHGKYASLHAQSFKSYKSEIHNKFFLIKKKTKHKKHKSGKKSASKRTITKKRKTVLRSPAVPEFQGKSFVRKQTVRELHSTLKRLLKELLPWEPKLMKAFHRNRARLKKDYDDFKKQPEHDMFTREVWTSEETDVTFAKESLSIDTKNLENSETLKKDDQSNSSLFDVDLPGRSRPPCNEIIPKEVPTTVPKTCKRQCKQDCCLSDDTKDILASKKIKLNKCEAPTHCTEGDTPSDWSHGELKHKEATSQEALPMTDSATCSTDIKVATPIQALTVKDSENNVTLTSQLLSEAAGSSINVSEMSTVSSSESTPTKSTVSHQHSPTNPLHVVYKMPGGQCVPVDLQNSTVKIQVQSMLDPTTGEKLIQQVLILPKNFFLQQKEGTSAVKENLPSQLKSLEQPHAPFIKATNINPAFSAPFLGNAPLVLPSSEISKNTPGVTKLPHSVSSPSLQTVTSLADQRSKSETLKVGAPITVFPMTSALSTISTAVKPSVSEATPNEDGSSFIFSHESLQKTKDLPDMKQELKTICIRDSQSILVRTRGGNTGVVKVQANSDNFSTHSLSTSSVFTYTPHSQAFLIPRNVTLPSPTSSAVKATTTVSTILPFAQSTMSQFSSVPPAPITASLNQLMGTHVNVSAGQPNSGRLGHLMDKTMQSSPFLATRPQSNSWLPPTGSSPVASVSVSGTTLNTVGSSSVGQRCSALITQVTQSLPDKNHKTNKLPTIHDGAVSANTDVINGAPVQKLLLVASPVIPSANTSAISNAAMPTSSVPAPQKLVFINTGISSGSPVCSVAADSATQVLPPILGNTFLKPEQPHLVLIPSTVGASVKLGPSPTVSQVKEMKIGLNIGQTIINNNGSSHTLPAVNVMQNAPYRSTDEKHRKGFVLPMTTSNLVPLCPMNRNIVVGNEQVDFGLSRKNTITGTTVNVCLGSISSTKSNTSIATPSAGLVKQGHETDSRTLSLAGPSLGTSNVGNTVAISTVKTSHLASSLMISSTKAHQNIPTTLFPGIVSLPASMTTTQKGNNLISASMPCLPLTKGQPQTLLRFQSPVNTAPLITSSNIQAVFPPASTNTGKVMNVASQPHASSKAASSCSSVPGVSTAMQTATASPLTSQAGQLGETCIQQKIVINTSTPLAPGTQIMINGIRFIVPPNGLAAGSHVLLISSSTKQAPPLVLNNAQGVQMNLSNSVIAKNLQSSLTCQPSSHPLKNSADLVNSLGRVISTPTVDAAQHLNTVTRDSVVPPAVATTVASMPLSQSVFVAKSSSGAPTHGSSSAFPSSTTALHLDKSISKLLVSPEGAILSSISTSIAKLTSLSPTNSHIVECSTTASPAIHPSSQSSGSDTLNIDAS
ncbi:uncharacterized bromodomain-containing protein 10 isoform X2 [Pleurodeles waltl]|uniref:uncharacterized bromodomain-containing protein 10 isoform X2 n=1 Tax=Pleurodeles waltl TaxID=8319 RepID=UPI0037094F8A